MFITKKQAVHQVTGGICQVHNNIKDIQDIYKYEHRSLLPE